MSLFEVIMLVCFGAAWPLSIYRSWTSRSCKGKSLIFLYVVLVGYLSGITHKCLYSRDWVMTFYVINALMVAVDIGLYYRNIRIDIKQGS